MGRIVVGVDASPNARRALVWATSEARLRQGGAAGGPRLPFQESGGASLLRIPAYQRRALIPEEAGQLLACFPLFWWDHVITLLGTGLRVGELARLRRRRVHLNQPIPTLQVVDVRYQAGRRFGSGFKSRPKSDASIREIPLAPQVVETIRRRLPPGSDPAALVFTGPGGGPGRRGSPGVKKGTAGLRPTAARVLGALRDHGPLTAEQLAAQLSTQGRTARVTPSTRR